MLSPIQTSGRIEKSLQIPARAIDPYILVYFLTKTAFLR